MFKLFACAICQIDLESGQGISIHEGLSRPGKLRPWDGPFLCHSCQEKKEAMEGKRHSRGINCPNFITTNCPSSFSHSLPNPECVSDKSNIIFLHLQIPRREIAGQVNRDWSRESSWGKRLAVWRANYCCCCRSCSTFSWITIELRHVGSRHAYIYVGAVRYWTVEQIQSPLDTTPASSAGLVAAAHAGNDDKRLLLLVKNVDSGQ
jgi:hypothetical protein